jgi:starch synthase
MKIVLAASSRFHSFHLAQQLKKRQHLMRFFTSAYEQGDFLLRSDVENNDLINFADRLYGRLRADFLISKGRWYGLKDTYFDFWLKKNIEQLEPFDVFVGWAHYWLTSASVIRSKGAKIVLEAGSFHIYEHFRLMNQEYDVLGLKPPRIAERNVDKILKEYQEADFIVTPAQHIKASFVNRGFNENKIFVVPCGVNVERFVSRERGENKTQFQVLFVGPLSIHKGVHYLLEAWNKLSLPINSTELLLVGAMDVTFKRVLDSLKIKSNVRIIPGVAQEHLVSIYNDASVFVLPSLEDGFGMVASEAMASGLPVICTENCGIQDLIQDGRDGFVVPARSSSALARKIQWCYENRSDAFVMGQKARSTIQNYTWDSYGDQIVKVYERIMGLEKRNVYEDVSKGSGFTYAP